MLTASEPLRPRTKEDYAYDVLRAAILRCEMKPGERIVIDTLSAQLGISPIPMRAALQRLQAEGLVEITAHTGAVVSDLSPANIEQVSQVLERLELMGFELAVKHANAADIVALRGILDGMDAALAEGNTDRWAQMNAEFHRTVAALSDNKLLAEFTGRALVDWNRLRRWYLADVELHLGEAQAEHRAMVESLARRDLSGLQRLLYDHHQRTREAHSRAVAGLAGPDARAESTGP